MSPYKLAPFPSYTLPHLSTIAPFSLFSGLEAVCAITDLGLLEHCLMQTEVLTSWLLPSKRAEFHPSFPEPGTWYLDFFPLGDLCTSISFNFPCLKFKIKYEKENRRGGSVKKIWVNIQRSLLFLNIVSEEKSD